MATLTGKTVKSNNTSLLKLNGDTGSTVAGASGNAVQVKTGDNDATPLYLNTDRVGIGETSPDKELHITRASGETTLRLESATHYSDILQSGRNLFIQNAAGEGNIIFYDDASERMRIDTYGTISCGAVVHGLAAVNVTSSTLAYGTHSLSKLKYVTVSADAQTLVLPAVQIGAVFIIVNIAADGGALLTIDPDDDDKFLTDIAGGVGTNGNTISNTKATQNQGDFVKLVGMHADGWAITEMRGIWADE